jgi:hypothetical protein
MYKIELNNSPCGLVDVDRTNTPYVFYTGGIAGVSDTANLKSDTETLKRSSDEIQSNG